MLWALALICFPPSGTRHNDNFMASCHILVSLLLPSLLLKLDGENMRKCRFPVAFFPPSPQTLNFCCPRHGNFFHIHNERMYLKFFSSFFLRPLSGLHVNSTQCLVERPSLTQQAHIAKRCSRWKIN